MAEPIVLAIEVRKSCSDHRVVLCCFFPSPPFFSSPPPLSEIAWPEDRSGLIGERAFQGTEGRCGGVGKRLNLDDFFPPPPFLSFSSDVVERHQLGIRSDAGDETREKALLFLSPFPPFALCCRRKRIWC